MATIQEYETISEFINDTKDFIYENRYHCVYLTNQISGILDKLIKPLCGFTIKSKRGIVVVLVTNHACLIYGKYSNTEVVIKISNRLESVVIDKRVVSGSKDLVEAYIKHNKFKYEVTKFRISYECLKVNNKINTSLGTLGKAEEKYIDTYVRFGMGFSKEYDDGQKADEIIMKDSILKSIKIGNIYHWQDDNAICGICRMHFDGFDHVLDFFFIDKDFRRKGYGYSIAYELTSYYLQNRTNKILLTADGNNPKSNAIFRKIGFKETAKYLKAVITLH